MYDKKYDYMITTTDNPFDPFTEFDSWYQYDEPRYHTCEYVARLSNVNEELLTDDENAQNLYDTYKRIVTNDFLNLYKIVFKEKNQDELDSE